MEHATIPTIADNYWQLAANNQGRCHGFKSGGIKRDSRAKKKFCTPTFGKVGGTIFYMWGTSKEISIIIKYTEICCLVVAELYAPLLRLHFSVPLFAI